MRFLENDHGFGQTPSTIGAPAVMATIDFSDLPLASRHRLTAAEIEAESILTNAHEIANQLVTEAYAMGVDHSGVGWSPGDIPLDLARKRFADARDRAAGYLFGAVANEYLKHGKLDIEGFNAKLDMIGNWIYQKFQTDRNVLDELKRYCRVVALRTWAAALEAVEVVECKTPTPGSLLEEERATGETSLGATPFRERASWLKDQLRERSWNKHDLSRQGGPDHKTVQKVLDGFAVREDVLEKIANALSKRNGLVTVLAIPED